MFDKLINYLMSIGNPFETDKGVMVIGPSKFDEAKLAKLAGDVGLSIIHNEAEYNPVTKETKKETLWIGKTKQADVSSLSAKFASLG